MAEVWREEDEPVHVNLEPLCGRSTQRRACVACGRDAKPGDFFPP